MPITRYEFEHGFHWWRKLLKFLFPNRPAIWLLNRKIWNVRKLKEAQGAEQT